MSNSLFLLCPTDCLEPIVNRQFNTENYFLTSLGNTFIYNSETIKHIKETIKTNDIKDVYFVLSLDNQIILDALGSQDFSDIKRLNSIYKEFNTQKETITLSLRKGNLQFSVLSYHLNKKIKELNIALGKIKVRQALKISGKIYDRSNNTFLNIYSDLIYLEKFQLN
ncbi:hypothetical protein [Seonamhaeicola marinus]|uniref:Uncharacterized protein n=1 Tax=Seonamhaeicola marinus TaxID=1912246 RepID=A0A5D0HNL6_9FLAO|nr:hypothetical protein [Seonamhaeicola marinus]TYA71657.1 hypothetical protein FUA24_19015 [Seonamhaeicola marinus]